MSPARSINDLLRAAVEAGASDLHVTVGLPPMLRVSGTLRPINETRLSPEETARLAYGMFNDYRKERFEQTWDVDFSYAVGAVGRFRVNVYRQRGSVGLCARVIPDRVPSIEDLNLPPILKELTRKPRGLVLVTGPTGHGKSTTLAAMIGFINDERNAHIMTIEDPIEYVFPHHKSIVNQREVGNDTQNFPNALRAVLREDPNVIVIGEMRDLETIAAALTIAETGHLVFATLHTANAAQSVDRVIDVFPPNQQQQIRVQLSTVVEAVLSQQLLAVQPMAEGAGAVENGIGSGDFLRATNRVPAMEIMMATPAIRNLIREGKTHQISSTVQTGSQYGMQTMDQALFMLYKRGLISADLALSRAIYHDDLRRTIDRDRAGSAAPAPGAGPRV
ncbi:MAG TPA: type IV pilus twitching motility protein PilT [bacterium]|nr:type IV pilus twitching motility protein PilT [bacterium]